GTVTGLLGASDLVSVNGSFSLASGAGGSSTLSLTDLGGNVHVANNTQFTLVTYSGGWNGGLFNVDGNLIPDGGLFTFGANQFQLDYDAGGSNVVLTVVPEPTTAAALLAGLGTLLGLRRRRNPAL
ncbi:MAG: autotransporter-associated beta strand repeat protein, partial [Chthoniobacteraceae bacterium]|nr:autotransporter-associated beta strand repeat protein [Chthoniobacteraceae bacterium]